MSLQNLIPFEEQFYDLGPVEIEYLKAQTGIDDDDSLKAHILQIQQKAYDVHRYRSLPTGKRVYDHYFDRNIPILVFYISHSSSASLCRPIIRD